MSEFDPEAAAGAALGNLEDNPEQANDVDPGGDSGDVAADTGGGGDSDGGVVHSLLFAPERGPTQRTFEEKGVGENIALTLDGATDWLIDVVGADDMGDSLGPLGKIGLGVTGAVADAGDDAGDDGTDPGGGDRRPDADDMEPVVG